MNKFFFQHICTAIVELLLRGSNTIKKPREIFLVEYFIRNEKQINRLLQNIRSEHEGK